MSTMSVNSQAVRKNREFAGQLFVLSASPSSLSSSFCVSLTLHLLHAVREASFEGMPLPRSKAMVTATLDNGRQRVDVAVRELSNKVSLRKEFELCVHVHLVSQSCFSLTHLPRRQRLQPGPRLLDRLFHPAPNARLDADSPIHPLGPCAYPACVAEQNAPRLPHLLVAQEEGGPGARSADLDARRRPAADTGSLLRLRLVERPARDGARHLCGRGGRLPAQEDSGRPAVRRQDGRLAALVQRLPRDRPPLRARRAGCAEGQPAQVDGRGPRRPRAGRLCDQGRARERPDAARRRHDCASPLSPLLLSSPSLSDADAVPFIVAQVWRRRIVKLRGSTLVPYNEVTKRSHVEINLAQVVAVEDLNAPSSARDDDDDDESVSRMDHSFRLAFEDGNRIDYFADSYAIKAKWLEVLAAVVGKDDDKKKAPDWAVAVRKLPPPKALALKAAAAT